MPIKLNLLPEGQRVGKDLAQILRITKMLGVIALGVFIVFVLGVVGYFIFSSTELSAINSDNNALKKQVLALKSSENKIMLLKDRISKIKTVQGLPSVVANLSSINTIISPLSTDSTVNELDISSAKVSTSVNFRSNSDLASFIKNVSLMKAFKTITLSSFSFSPVSGYLVSIALSENK